MTRFEQTLSFVQFTNCIGNVFLNSRFSVLSDVNRGVYLTERVLIYMAVKEPPPEVKERVERALVTFREFSTKVADKKVQP